MTEAAFRQKINIPMECRDGVCGTCWCRAEKGWHEPESRLDEAMTEEEAAQGDVLTCRTMPQSDCIVSTPAAPAMCKTAPETVTGEVPGMDRLSETSFGLRVKLPGPIGFLPGQYVNVGAPGTDRHRSCSLFLRAGF